VDVRDCGSIRDKIVAPLELHADITRAFGKPGYMVELVYRNRKLQPGDRQQRKPDGTVGPP
jgi:hypothetical protein